MHFQNLGEHCTEPTCRQKDFLPFTCDFCAKTFCMEHRSEASHDCEKKNKGNMVSIKCPLCLKVLTYDSGVTNENDVFNIHQNKECNTANYAPNSRAVKIKTCPVKGCKTKLSSVNKHQCRDCYQELCLMHRFRDQHQCIPDKPIDNWIITPKKGYIPPENTNPSIPQQNTTPETVDYKQDPSRMNNNIIPQQNTIPETMDYRKDPSNMNNNTIPQQNIVPETVDYRNNPSHMNNNTYEARTFYTGSQRPPGYEDYIKRRKMMDEGRLNDAPQSSADNGNNANAGSKGDDKNIFTKAFGFMKKLVGK